MNTLHEPQFCHSSLVIQVKATFHNAVAETLLTSGNPVPYCRDLEYLIRYYGFIPSPIAHTLRLRGYYNSCGQMMYRTETSVLYDLELSNRKNPSVRNHYIYSVQGCSCTPTCDVQESIMYVSSRQIIVLRLHFQEPLELSQTKLQKSRASSKHPLLSTSTTIASLLRLSTAGRRMNIFPRPQVLPYRLHQHPG